MFKLSSNSAHLLLLIAAVIWGSTFVAQQIAMKYVDVYIYSGLRFIIGALFILPILIYKSNNSSNLLTSPPKKFLPSLGLGLLLFGGVITQQIGIKYTSVTNAGFLTALYVPLVPFFAWLIFKKTPSFAVWISAVGSSIGIIFISGGNLTSLNIGDVWVLVSVFFWALHVLFVGAVAIKSGNPLLVAFLQFMICGLLSLFIGLIFETINLTLLYKAIPTILWGGVLSVGIAFTLQVVAQQHTKPAIAAIIFSSEFIFATISAVIYLGDSVSTMQIIGGIIITICIVIIQIKPN